jgi:cysteine desulfurase
LSTATRITRATVIVVTAGSHHDTPNGGYLDAATAAPLHPVARQALLAALDEGWADPERLYTAARRARQLLDAATAATAQALSVREDEITFCASGTDAAHRAVAGALRAERTGAIVHSAIEHSAVLAAAAAHEAAGGAGSVVVGVDRHGRVDLDAFTTAVRGRAVGLAALISASHEVGTVQPVEAAARVCARVGVPLYVDAAASVGHRPVPEGWSILTASARKWGGPPGVGVLAVRTGTRFDPGEPAPGPVNIPAIVAAAASLRATVAESAAESARLGTLIATVRDAVASTIPDVEVVGDPQDRLPHIVTFSCLYVEGEALVAALDRHGFAVSSGSACANRTEQPSHVLAAMGALTHGNIRVSLHPGVGERDVERFLRVLPGVVAGLRAETGVAGL